MIKALLIIFNCLFIVAISFGQIKGRKVLYDDWPTTRTSNARIDKKSNDPTVYFVPIGTTWDHRIITYFFQNGTNDIDANNERQAIRDAFTFWANETDLAFLEVCNVNEADIVILWASFNHGDTAPFDGQGGVLAHTLGGPPPNDFGAQAGDIHFDDSETWTLDSRNNENDPVDLVTVAAHEIGHALGLDHTTVSGSLMLATYTGSHRFLGGDDIAGIQSLYGTKNDNIISGPDNLCTSDTYSIPNLRAGATVSWSVSPSGIVSTSPSGNSVVLTRITDGSVTLTASVISGCGNLTLSKNIYAGLPPASGSLSSSVNPLCPGEIKYTSVQPKPGITSYLWYTNSSGISVYGSGNSATIEGNAPGTYQFTIRTINECGFTEQVYFVNVLDYGDPRCSGAASVYTVYPNPASTELNISNTERTGIKDATPKDGSNPEFLVRLYNEKGNILRSAKNPKGSKGIKLDIIDIPNGTYYLHISKGKEVFKKQIIIQH